MPKPKRLYHSGAIVPNDYDFDKNERVLLMVCVPKSPLWIAMYKGLLSMPTNYWFWRLDSTIAHNSVKLAKDVFYNGVFMTCFNELNYNLQEMNFTLKRIENNLSNNKTIATFGQQPTIARLEDGTIDTATNNSVSNSSVSVFEFGSLLETNNISEVLAIALLDDSTIQLPDINPFNLESKLDDIRTDINETKLHFTNDFTDLMNYFASSFREGTWSPLSILNNPFANQSIYQMVLDTFNDTQKTYATVYIPFWGNTSLPVWTKNHSLIDKFNQNFSNTFNEDFNENTDLSSNSYFRGFHYWLTTDWKLFEDIMSAMRDCICSANDFLEQINLALWGDDNTNGLTHIKNSINTVNSTIASLDLSPVINVDACCEDTTDSITNMGDTITNLGDTITNLVNNVNNSINHIGDILNDNSVTTTVTDNGDGTYTIVNNNGDTIEYVNSPTIEPDNSPIDPTNPDSPDNSTYQTVSLTKLGNSQDAVCGFIYYTLSQFADFVEYLIGWLDGIIYIVKAIGADKWAITQLGLATMATNNIYIGKLGKAIIRGIASKYMALGGIVVSGLPDYIREVRDDLSCGSNRDDIDVGTFEGEVIQALQVLSLQNQQLDFASYLIHIFYSYGLYSPLENATGINIADYAQYCPCPLEGDFSGHWYNNDTVNPYHLYLTANGSGQGWNGLTVSGGQYYQNYFDMTQSVSNPLYTSGSARIYNNVLGTLSGIFNGVSFTLNSTKDQITMDNGIVFTKV